jgi:hypothetical protein
MRVMKIVDRWNIFVVAGTALCTCIGGFLIAPPLYKDSTSYHFAVFLVTVLVALWSIPVSLWASRTDLRAWTAGAIVLFVLSISGYFFYDHLLSSWTFFYQPGKEPPVQVIQGATLTQQAHDLKAHLLAQGRPAGPAVLLDAADSIYGEVWPNEDERESRARILERTYLALFLIFASTVVATVQATFCVNQTDSEGPVDPTAQPPGRNAALPPAAKGDAR